jgi:hypothetical protein
MDVMALGNFGACPQYLLIYTIENVIAILGLAEEIIQLRIVTQPQQSGSESVWEREIVDPDYTVHVPGRTGVSPEEVQVCIKRRKIVDQLYPSRRMPSYLL